MPLTRARPQLHAMLRLHEYAYHRPTTVAEAAALLAAHPGRAQLIAGGTDLMPNMKHGLFTPSHVIALKQIEELHGIAERDGELVIGAAESLTSVSRHPAVQRFTALARAARNEQPKDDPVLRELAAAKEKGHAALQALADRHPKSAPVWV